jgi:protein-L-isoaspartate(D-aspartate) O-methyltransferase
MKDDAMDFGLARVRMIESQIRPNGVTDQLIIQTMAAIPREIFVPPSRRSLAYMDEMWKSAPGITQCRASCWSP